MEYEEELHLTNEEEDDVEKLGGFLLKLKSAQRLCLEMMYFQNMSYKAISLETGFVPSRASPTANDQPLNTCQRMSSRLSVGELGWIRAPK